MSRESKAKKKKDRPWYSGLVSLKTGTGIAGVIIVLFLILTGRVTPTKFSFFGIEMELGKPAPAATLEATVSATAEEVQPESGVLQVTPRLSDYCLTAFLLPDEVDPAADPVKATEEFNRQIQDGRADAWIKVPARHDEIVVKVSGLPGNRSWAKLENEAQVSISVNKNVPEHVNLVHDCAGGGEVREFEPITLEADKITAYSVKVSYPGAEFLTLQPGEFEELGFFFKCQSPGFYRVNIELPYEYETDHGLVGILSHTLLCPKTFTEWSNLAGPPMVSVGKYEWNGSEYVEVSQ